MPLLLYCCCHADADATGASARFDFIIFRRHDDADADALILCIFIYAFFHYHFWLTPPPLPLISLFHCLRRRWWHFHADDAMMLFSPLLMLPPRIRRCCRRWRCRFIFHISLRHIFDAAFIIADAIYRRCWCRVILSAADITIDGCHFFCRHYAYGASWHWLRLRWYAIACSHAVDASLRLITSAISPFHFLLMPPAITCFILIIIWYCC